MTMEEYVRRLQKYVFKRYIPEVENIPEGCGMCGRVQCTCKAQEEQRAFLELRRKREEHIRERGQHEIIEGGQMVQRTMVSDVSKRILKSKARGAMSLKSKGAYKAVILNQVWTQERLAQAGYETDGSCRLCGQTGHWGKHDGQAASSMAPVSC